MEPLYKTEDEALRAEGEVYRHYKGGIYRLVHRGVKHSETGEVGVLYEHLWPHAHTLWFRPETLFFGMLENGEPRFKPVRR